MCVLPVGGVKCAKNKAVRLDAVFSTNSLCYVTCLLYNKVKCFA